MAVCPISVCRHNKLHAGLGYSKHLFVWEEEGGLSLI